MIRLATSGAQAALSNHPANVAQSTVSFEQTLAIWVLTSPKLGSSDSDGVGDGAR